METIHTVQHGLAPAVAAALLHSLWQGTLLAGAAALTLRAMARASAAWRHAAGMAFLATMAAAPLVQAGVFLARPDALAEGGVLPVLTAPQPGGADLFVQQSSPGASARMAL